MKQLPFFIYAIQLRFNFARLERAKIISETTSY